MESLIREREQPSCVNCGSTLRFRSIIRALSIGLYGKSLALPDFPKCKNKRGIGLSEWPGYLPLLEEKFDFLNTFYHQEPFLDITNPPDYMFGSADFLISSEVFEHIPPPVQRAFDGAYSLLKPGGLLILTVPFRTETEETDEHFPELYNWSINKENGRYILRNITADGREQVFTDLCFHGGSGLTLEMRVFSRLSLEHHLVVAGFKDISLCSDNDLEFGILWSGEWSVPIMARKPS
ncbi:class I SAM-dependent methyltransferase [Thermanaerothrix daxensis]|uniref:class I SAM-dependent methyltransferase n=1 Tax=Thermanaerothrix daxensis TaxID=869279 RepID=UPI00128F0E32|nr:methyltransferase domain-containing protein [Thermanaerothrix daxensis]